MYLGYFGLTERPFSIAPDPQYLYMSKRHKEAMAHLSYGLSQGGCFIVLTGEVGTGKTTLCRNLLGHLPDNVDVALILNANINEQELLQTVCDELKITYQEGDSQKQLLDKINMSLLATFADNRQTVLIIDEAQLLSRDVLEQVRLLTNLETTKSKLLQIILIGQPELSDVLERNDLRQLAQRVTARYHLGALQRDEIQEYVNFRLSVAGCKQPLFSRQAVTQIHQLTDGIPRKINVLADHALLSAYANTQRIVDSKTIKRAARDVFINTRKKHQPSGFQLPNWWWAIPLVLLLNIGLWAWFARGDSNESASNNQPSSQVATQTTTEQQEPNESSQASVSEDSIESDFVEPAFVEPDFAEAKALETVAVDEPKIEPAAKEPSREDVGAEGNVVVVNTDENIAPGTVQVSEEFLDASPLEQGSSQDVSQSEQSFIDGIGFAEESSTSSANEVDVATANPDFFDGLTESEYLQDTSFGRALETSADLTGRIEVFKVLSNQWGASLPRKLLKPACDALLEEGLQCLAFDTWGAFARLNRPGILVVNHKNQLHRVIVQSVSNDVASVLVGEQYYEVPITELLGRWTNRGVLFWRPSAVGEQFLKQGSEGPAVLAMRARLNRALTAVDLPILDSVGNSLFDSDMRQKVFALQARFGLNQDGQIGYETHFLINEILAPSATVVLSAERRSRAIGSAANGLEPPGGQ